MIQCNNTNIKKVKINYVGNRIAGEDIILSSDSLTCDDLTQNLLGHYLLKDVSYFKLYHFVHDIDIKYNKVYSLAKSFFKGKNDFDSLSDEISEVLYDVAKDKSVKSGYLFTVLFKDCVYDDNEVDAIGIFKAEATDIFLKILNDNSKIEIAPEQGFSIGNLGKGCIIFNNKVNDGLRLAILNKSRSKASEKYWNKDFLECEPIINDYLNTQAILKSVAQFIKGQDTDNIQKTSELNKTIKAVQEDRLDVDSLISKLASNSCDKDKIKQIYCKLIGKEESIPSTIVVDKTAVKQTRIKSSLKLDKNFEIIFHGGADLIETGIDSITGMKYIKLSYKQIH